MQKKKLSGIVIIVANKVARGLTSPQQFSMVNVELLSRAG